MASWRSPRVSRRAFAAGLAASLGISRAWAAARGILVSVFADEITDDVGRACEVAASEFGLRHVELRSGWKTSLTRLDDKQLGEVEAILRKNQLAVSSIAGPLFKVDWEGAPLSKFSPSRNRANKDWTFGEQDEVLEREIDLARRFKTERIRCFDFWQLDDVKPHREAINAKLQAAAEKAGKAGLTLVMENEPSCNTRTAVDAVATLRSVPSRHFKLNWDPGNSYFAGETPYPDAYALLPKDRIGHVHCKDAVMGKDGTPSWECMGRGKIDFVGQFRGLARDGYRGFVVLETHWHGAGTREESTRQSMAGMKKQLAEAGLA
jgi:sugar phosphate isomerase/epimerase